MADADGDESDIGLFNSLHLTNRDVSNPPSLQSHRWSLDRRTSLTGSLHSPSSPDLPLPGKVRAVNSHPPSSIRGLSRSRSLPRRVSLGSPSAVEESLFEPEKLRKLRQWIVCIASVNFDLDVGPVVDCVYPSIRFSVSESENIAFSSFPDSAQFDEGSQVHSFRIRVLSSELRRASPSSVERSSLEDDFVYGYSFFSQERDSGSKRGYKQRTIVILTYHPFPALFSSLISTLGPLHQQHGQPMLEAACHNIANWPSPTPRTTVELGFLGSVFQVDLPGNAGGKQLTQSSSNFTDHGSDVHILASMPPVEPSPLALFARCLSHMWSIWECLVLCEPILVFGPSPSVTSQAIWWFIDVLRPIPQAGDFRPYFTIHDHDYTTFVNKMPPKSGLLLGVTNPFFEGTCKHWPHILSLGRESLGAGDPSNGRLLTNGTAVTGPPPGWKTKTHNRYTSKDRVLLKTLNDACKGGTLAENEASTLLHHHFSSRTAALLVPLDRYLNTLIPPSSGATASPRMRAFNSANFFASLKTHGSLLPFRSAAKQKEFYERWLRTPAFGRWLASQEEVVHRFLREKAESLGSPRVI